MINFGCLSIGVMIIMKYIFLPNGSGSCFKEWREGVSLLDRELEMVSINDRCLILK